jgi:hypothetical protein
MTSDIRRWITLAVPTMLKEGDESVVSNAFFAALRAWGDNTVFDRDRKTQALLRFEPEASRFRTQHDWLYRGHSLRADDFRTLRLGGTIDLNLPLLSSWSADSDVAHIFARFAGEGDAQIVIMQRDLACFFDFAKLGMALEHAGIEVKENEYNLHDPIREQEVIVRLTAPLMISKRDVLEAFYFDTKGKQHHVGRLR